MDFFTADLHCFHDKPTIVQRRGYDNLRDMHFDMVNTWNNNVQPDDRVFIIGDVSSCRSSDIPELDLMLSSMNGNKFLIPGNHDNEKFLKRLGHHFTILNIRHILKIKEDDKTYILVLDHFPLLTWERAGHGSWHLHGHAHGNLTVEPSTRLDVGWDVWKRPISFKDIKEVMSNRKYHVVDHHGIVR